MTPTSHRIVSREVSRNLRRNPWAALSVVFAIGLAGILVGSVVEWWMLVDRAATATSGTRVALGVAPQLSARPAALLVAVVAAELIAFVTTHLAMGRRRRSEATVFEALGAPDRYFRAPAMVEGLTEGLAGGLLAAMIAVAAGPWIAHGERSTLASSYTLGCFTSRREARSPLCGGRQTSLVEVHLDLSHVHLAASQDVRVAVVLIALGTLLGLFNASPVLRRPTMRLGGRRRGGE